MNPATLTDRSTDRSETPHRTGSTDRSTNTPNYQGSDRSTDRYGQAAKCDGQFGGVYVVPPQRSAPTGGAR